MESLFRFVAPASRCGYLPEQNWQLEYELVAQLSPAEYLERMEQGWRRFGRAMFRPRCAACQACRSLRVIVDGFRPDRSQRRVRQQNEKVIERRVGPPQATRAKLRLYDRYHAFQSERKGWPEHDSQDAGNYVNSFVDNPFWTEEWGYYLDGQLVGIGYVDRLPGALSAIYCFYEPELRRYAPGTWNVLCILEEAARCQIPFVYLGYYVEGCPSMEYKTRFAPNQVLGADGRWRDFRD